MIYFIQEQGNPQGPIKVGYAGDPKKRLGQIQLMSPVRLHILAIITGDRGTERVLHNYFYDERLHGEWFQSKAVLSFLEKPVSILEMEQLPTRSPYITSSDLDIEGGKECCLCSEKVHKDTDFCYYHRTTCEYIDPIGYRCQHDPLPGYKYCGQHSPDRMCQANSKDGTRCRSVIKLGQTYCHKHLQGNGQPKSETING